MAGDAFSLAEFMAARGALRRELGAAEERFPLPALVGMISDEIEALRAAGRSDGAIAALVSAATGRAVGEADIGRHYAPPEARHPPG